MEVCVFTRNRSEAEIEGIEARLHAKGRAALNISQTNDRGALVLPCTDDPQNLYWRFICILRAG